MSTLKDIAQNDKLVNKVLVSIQNYKLAHKNLIIEQNMLVKDASKVFQARTDFGQSAEAVALVKRLDSVATANKTLSTRIKNFSTELEKYLTQNQ